MSRLVQELLRIERHFVLAKHEYLHLFTPDGVLLHQLGVIAGINYKSVPELSIV